MSAPDTDGAAVTVTPVEFEVLGFVERYIARHHFAPSVREILAWREGSSTNWIDQVLDSLQEKRCITRQPDVARSIVVLRPASSVAVSS